MSARRIAIATVGCKLNQAETECLAAALTEAGHRVVEWSAPADVFIVNTCTVTAKADGDSRARLRQARRRSPEALVIVLGCYAETDADALEDLPDVDWVVRRAELHDLPAALAENRRPEGAAAPEGWMPPRPTLSNRTRVRLILQDGCERFCSYCKVPFARGPERSVPVESALEELRRLAATGAPEIVLVGCNLGAYGRTLDRLASLAEFLRRALDLDLPRLRLGSIEPDLLTDELCATIADAGDRICPHLHIPLQSASASVLAAMGRDTDTGTLLERVEGLRARRGRFAVGLDLLVGFPCESEEDHASTLAFVREVRPSRLHVFPFSPREGTRAAALGDPVALVEKRRRAAELRALGESLATSFAREHLGQTVAVAEGGEGFVPGVPGRDIDTDD